MAPPQHYSKAGTTGSLSVAIAGAQQLSDSDYRLDFRAGNYTLTRLSDHSTVYNGGAPPAAPVEGLSITVANALGDGDSFLIRPTANVARQMALQITDPRRIAAAGGNAGLSNGVGDNSNATALANLQNSKSLLNGAATYHDAYSAMVGAVGTKAHSAEVMRDEQKHLLDQAVAERSNESGVNLDQEMADLVRFQQAYQASAHLISVVNTLFDALIGAIKR